MPEDRSLHDARGSNVGQEQWVYWLKAVACILITNSHCRNIYPYEFLAVGGGFGNALFFIINGYLLAYPKNSFIEWYRKRISRMLPAVVVFVTLDLLTMGGWKAISDLGLVDAILYYPRKYWFISALLIYYPLFYLLFSRVLRGKEKRSIEVVACWALLYFLLYYCVLDRSRFSVELGGFSWFKVYFYFGIMLLGGICRINRSNIETVINQKTINHLLLLTAPLSMICWAIIYMYVYVYGKLLEFQFLIHLFVLAFAVAVLILSWLIKHSAPSTIRTISNSTLEIYLFQATFNYDWTQMHFPLNWLIFWASAFGGGIIIHYLIARFWHFNGRLEKCKS